MAGLNRARLMAHARDGAMAQRSGETQDIAGAQGMARVGGFSWPGVAYFCTTRAGGASTGSLASMNLAAHVGDLPQRVDENRRRLERAWLPSPPLWLEQVHGARVHDADARAWPARPPRADASITGHRERVLAILSADCLPVVLADAGGTVLGVAHAGWRGLAAGVLENTLERLRARQPSARSWRAWLGPAIRQAHFEVGADVLSAFTASDPGCARFFAAGRHPGKWQADLAGLAAHRLRRAGVEAIEDSGYCTYERADLFYSHRRDPASGRMATLAWLPAD